MTPASDEEKYRALFLEESQELLDGFLNGLFELQSRPDDASVVDELFRVAHTLKGMAGAMGYSTVADFCHRAENYLDRWRRDRVAVSPGDIDFMFQVEGALRDMTVNPEDVASHQDALALFSAEPEGRVQRERAAVPTLALSGFEPPEPGETGLIVALEEEVAYPRLRFKMVLGRLEKHASSVRPVPPMDAWDELPSGSSVTFYLRSDEPEDVLLQAAVSVGEVAVATLLEACAESAPPAATPAPLRAAPPVPSFQQTGIRVDRRKLDQITNMVGEMLLLRRRLTGLAARYEDPELDDVLDQIEQASLDLERLVLSARMVPVGSIFQRFQRLVQELADQLGKEVDAEFVGGETEIDRSLLERVSEPLVHILRNSLDHGIESPGDRVAAGKPARGRIRVTAAMEHGNVALKVEDDGRGIDANAVLEAARRKGLVTGEEELTRAQVFSLLFTPGFSTASQVTDISGRGVGLDVVRKKVAEVGGDLNMVSDKGQGTKVILEFPPTLSLLRSLVVSAGGLIVGVPQNQVYRIVRLCPGDISWVKESPVVLVEDRPVIVRSFAGLLSANRGLNIEDAQWVLLVRSSSRLEALAIDRLIADQDLVIKPLMRSLSRSPGIVGTCLVADGRLALFADLRLLLLHHNAITRTSTMEAWN